MDDETQDQDQEEIEQSTSPIAKLKAKLSAALLRVLDAGLAALQKMRARIAPPVEDDESEEHERRSSRFDDEPEPAEAVVVKKSFTRRALTVLMLLLLGGTLGMMVSYRLFEKQIEGKARLIEYMQVEVDETRKDELRNQSFRDRQQQQIGEYRRLLSKMQIEVEDYKSEIEDYKVAIDELKTRPRTTRRASRSATPGNLASRVSSGAKSSESGNPYKAGSCVTGTSNLNDNLINCIEAFNRQ
ncbi:MAG: hypothetical protein K9J74_09275 [Sulfuritalea sp.]|nr:hypothetical protein [Sulfuritalea sp.]